MHTTQQKLQGNDPNCRLSATADCLRQTHDGSSEFFVRHVGDNYDAEARYKRSVLGGLKGDAPEHEVHGVHHNHNGKHDGFVILVEERLDWIDEHTDCYS